MEVSGNTTLYGVIGTPIKHTLSPKIYNTAFNYHNIDSVYMAFECGKDEVKDTLSAVRRLDIKGLNVTMPCKQEVYKNMDKLEGAAKYAGAVNTVVNNDGVLTGYITDGIGVVLDLKDHGIDIKDKNVVLMGVGGAGSAIMVQLALDGAKSIHIFNRGTEKLEFTKDVGHKMSADGVKCMMSFSSFDDKDIFYDAIKNADILINATSVGMAPDSVGKTLVDDTSVFSKNLVLYECVYNPSVTKLMEDAKNAGCTVIGGKGMLLWQAAGAFKIYTRLELPVELLKENGF